MNERIHERVNFLFNLFCYFIKFTGCFIIIKILLQIMDHVMAGIEDVLGKHGNYHLRDK